MEQAGRDQQDWQGQAAVEGAAEEQAVEGAAVVQVDLGAADLADLVDLAAAVVQVGLVVAVEQADLEAAEEVHWEDQQGHCCHCLDQHHHSHCYWDFQG